MFSIDQIKAAHSRVKSGADFPAYIQDLIKLGVTSYSTYVSDGHTNYYGANGFSISSPAKYESKVIATTSHKTDFINDLKAHQQGKTDYPTFCNDCARSGVNKWTVNMADMTCSYYDKQETTLLVEIIPGL
jgi:uncharacterized protein YbcV (DUF1398 family)